jgi:hypothetical protein
VVCTRSQCDELACRSVELTYSIAAPTRQSVVGPNAAREAIASSEGNELEGRRGGLAGFDVPPALHVVIFSDSARVAVAEGDHPKRPRGSLLNDPDSLP